MKIRGVEANSVVREIGSLFRRHDGADWHISVKLVPVQKKQYFGVSQIPILARRRVINAGEKPRPAGFQSRVVIESARLWLVKPIEACPIRAVSRQDDGKQWCFNFEFGGTQYYLPQLELARALFFHYAYITRLALIPSGLSQEFDVQRADDLGKVLVNILPTCTLPRYVRVDSVLRRLLAWVLLDEEVRQSFDSIARYQLQNGSDTNVDRRWRFQFEPPPLAGVKLTLRGHYDQERNAYFVYEIDRFSNLTGHGPANVEFVDPWFVEERAGQGRAVRSGPQSGPQLEIDDEQEPDADHTEVRIETPAVAFGFVNPILTTLIGKGKYKSGSQRQEGDQSDAPEHPSLEVSTDEANTRGTLPSADYDGLEDESDDAHLYMHKFEAFNAMVLQLVDTYGCSHIHRATRKLPAIDGYSKHLLADGNPRCLSFHRIEKHGRVYALIEVDTSDNKNSLSTLLIKQHDMSFDWEVYIRNLESRLIKGSLAWPTEFIENAFGSGHKRVSHPRSSSEGKLFLDQDSILRWAERVCNFLE